MIPFDAIKIVISAAIIISALGVRRQCWHLRDKLLLAVFLATVPSKVHWEVFGLTVRFEQVMCLLLATVVLIDIVRKKITVRFGLSDILVFSLLPFMFFSSAFVATDTAFSLQKSCLYLPYFAGYAATRIALQNTAVPFACFFDEWYRFGVAMVFLGLIAYPLSLCGIDLGMMRDRIGSLWVVGPMAVSNIYGHMAWLFAAVSLVQMVRGRSSFDFLAHGICACGVVWSMSRAPWLALFFTYAACFFWWLMTRNVRHIKSLCWGMFCCLLAVGLGAVLPNVFASKITVDDAAVSACAQGGRTRGDSLGASSVSRSDFVPSEDFRRCPGAKAIDVSKKSDLFRECIPGESWRYRIYKTALSKVFDSPFVGHGTEDLIASHGYDKSNFYIGSSWVSILHDWGVVAFVSHVFFLFVVLVARVNGFRQGQNPDDKIINGAVLLVMFFEVALNQVSTTMQLSIFWIMIAVVVHDATKDFSSNPGNSTAISL